jgi:RNA polymerase sigma factor (sigma-70 family)
MTLYGVSTTEPADPLAKSPGLRHEEFALFYRREFSRSVRLVWLLTGSQAVAEDIVQEAMAELFGRFSRVRTPEAYLRRGLVNGARRWHRREGLRRERLGVFVGEEVILDERDSTVLEAVGRLPYRQRVVIVARYWGGWTEADIASVLRCRPGTVKSLASRALARLRREVEQ